MADSPALPSGPAALTLRTEIALPDRPPELRPVLESSLCLASGRITTVCPPELLTMAGSEQIWRFQSRSLAAVLANLTSVGMTGPRLEAEPAISEAIAAPDPSLLSEPPLAPDWPEEEAFPVDSPGAVPECEQVSPGPMASEPVPFPVSEAAAEATSGFEVPPVTPAPDPELADRPLDWSDPHPVASVPEPVPSAAPPVVDTQAATVVVSTAEPQGAPWQMTRPTAAVPAAPAANAPPAWMTEMPAPNAAADPAPLPWGDIDLPSAADTAFTPPDWLSTPPTSEDASSLDLFASLDLQEPVELPDLEPNPLADLELPPLSPKRS